MEKNKETIRGLIYYANMQCRNCRTVLQIEETESSITLVNAKGLPLDCETTAYTVVGVCPKCGKKYAVDKQGMYFTIYNETYALCPHLRAKDMMEDRDRITYEV